MKYKNIKSYKYSRKDKRKKRYKRNKRRTFLKNFFFDIGSPHNTNQYLINVNSSCFLNGDNNDSFVIIPSSLIFLNDDPNEELKIFNYRENDTTKENTEIFKDNQEQNEHEISIKNL